MEPIVDNPMNTPVKVSPWKTGMKWGIVAGLLSIIFSIISYSMKDNPVSSEGNWINMIVGIAIAVFCISMASKEHRDKDLDGFMSYGRGLGVGTITALFSSLLSAVFTYIYFTYMIDFDTLMDAEMRRAMEEKAGQMSEEQMEQAIEMGKKFTSPLFFVFGTIFGGTFFGFIISLITSAVFKKDRPI